jgi:2,5-furandicarboxylate decarboxylase 1
MTARHPTSPTLADWLADPRVPLRIVEDLVDPAAFEATAILEQLEPQGAPPVLFPRVRSLDGSEGEFQLLFNAYGALPSVAAALNASAASWPALLKDYVKRVRELREPTRSTTAAVQENVVAGSDVDLRILPWTKHVAGEGGEYFTPIAVARDPGGSRRYNLSWNRAMYLDPRRIGVHISPRDLWSFHRAAEGAGKPLPVALVLGHHPAFNLGAAALATSSLDEYHIAGALLGEGVRVAPSQSYGEELLIPADAEVVIEGRLLPGVRTAEGPFGEYLRYLGPQKISHVVEVDAITWRKGAVILEIFTCHLDHLNAHVSIEASFLDKAQGAVPQVSGVSWFRGGGPTTLVIAMRKTAEGQPMRAAMAAMSASNLVKQVIVVDDDIDIEDAHQVLWAVSTRLRAESGLVPLKNLPGIPLDPSGAGPFDPTSGFVMDATWPLGRPYPPTGRVADSVLARFPLSRYRIKDPRC